MQPEPDPRWAHIAGGITDDGRVQPMTFEVLAGLASEWADLLPGSVGGDGPAALLRMARSLFAHSWFDYEFMVVACLVGFQAMEAAFRLLYPEAERTPFRALVRRAHREGILPSNIAELAESGAELRNLFSHPATQAAFSVGMAAPMLENTHRMVALVMTAAVTSAAGCQARRDSPTP
jgi:hypothetical protein